MKTGRRDRNRPGVGIAEWRICVSPGCHAGEKWNAPGKGTSLERRTNGRPDLHRLARGELPRRHDLSPFYLLGRPGVARGRSGCHRFVHVALPPSIPPVPRRRPARIGLGRPGMVGAHDDGGYVRHRRRRGPALEVCGSRRGAQGDWTLGAHRFGGSCDPIVLGRGGLCRGRDWQCSDTGPHGCKSASVSAIWGALGIACTSTSTTTSIGHRPTPRTLPAAHAQLADAGRTVLRRQGPIEHRQSQRAVGLSAQSGPCRPAAAYPCMSERPPERATTP